MPSSSVTFHNLPVNSTAKTATNCKIPLPKIMNSSQTGTRPVCSREAMHIVNTTGLLRNHGPRGIECKGSHLRPFPGSQQSVRLGAVSVMRRSVRPYFTSNNYFARLRKRPRSCHTASFLLCRTLVIAVVIPFLPSHLPECTETLFGRWL
jgi:hypothetical protein